MQDIGNTMADKVAVPAGGHPAFERGRSSSDGRSHRHRDGSEKNRSSTRKKVPVTFIQLALTAEKLNRRGNKQKVGVRLHTPSCALHVHAASRLPHCL